MEFQCKECVRQSCRTGTNVHGSAAPASTGWDSKTQCGPASLRKQTHAKKPACHYGYLTLPFWQPVQGYRSSYYFSYNLVLSLLPWSVLSKVCNSAKKFPNTRIDLKTSTISGPCFLCWHDYHSPQPCTGLQLSLHSYSHNNGSPLLWLSI